MDKQRGFGLLEIIIVVGLIALFSVGGFYAKNLMNSTSTGSTIYSPIIYTEPNDVENGLNAIQQARDVRQKIESQSVQDENLINNINPTSSTSTTKRTN